ncbi:MAG: hypothetical protein MHMPM18_003765 [Marteilia pararefringens]
MQLNLLILLDVFKFTIDDFHSFLEKRQKFNVKVLVNNECSLSLINNTIPDYVVGSEDCYENFGFVSSTNEDANINTLNTVTQVSNSDSKNQLKSSGNTASDKELNQELGSSTKILQIEKNDSLNNEDNRSESNSKNSAPMTDAHQIIPLESSVAVKSDRMAGAIKRFKIRQIKSHVIPVKALVPNSKAGTTNRNLKVNIEQNQLLVSIRFEKLQEQESPPTSPDDYEQPHAKLEKNDENSAGLGCFL